MPRSPIGPRHPVDTGFLVFNHRTYPNLRKLFETLGVAIAATFNTTMQTAHNIKVTDMPGMAQRMGREQHQLMNPSGM